ncbi:hypothetical protein [Rhizobium sp. PL01]|uniref:hypothetical protein n=1 Tax=Rhizobium sp. PL01 TaxID=3085631 RepID=UPI002981F0B6|nr:hypothetical protein [Rhizobium sp. PL01]MDW5315030.1 hypothetical protein [Rhizobium sp. PL01]
MTPTIQMNVAGELCSLADCPPGPFLFNGMIGFKTEYGAMSGKDIGGGKVEWEVTGGPDVYVMDSGETFWGGTSSKEARAALHVLPLKISMEVDGDEVNDLCLVPGAIDQYIPRGMFDQLYPGQTPEATMPAEPR